MNKIAILSDIHGNLPALKAVLREVAASGANQIAVLGDIVGYGASPAECVELCGSLSAIAVLGNHELSVLALRSKDFGELGPGWEKSGFLAGYVHAAAALDEDQADWLSKLPYTRPVEGALIGHACLSDPQEFPRLTSYDEAMASLEVLAGHESKVGFLGHTHAQEIFHHPEAGIDWESENCFTVPESEDCVVMVGSVGQPRDENDKRAAWAIWEPEERRVHLMKTDYNRISAAQQIVEANLPLESALRILNADELSLLTS